MFLNQRWSSSMIASFWLAMIVVVWAAFAPTQFGGSSSFLLISGNSMEPDFHFGDLVIVHNEPVYAVGDIVAYRNFDLGANVFHRIIGRENDRFIMKGDNNSWIDSYHPLPGDVIGKLWIFLPGAGQWITMIRQPLNMGLIAGLLAGLMAIGISKERVRWNGRMNVISIQAWTAGLAAPLQAVKNWVIGIKARRGKGSSPGPKRNPPTSGTVETIFFILGAVAFTSLIIAIVVFTRPATTNVPDEVNFQHVGIFTYSGSAPAGVYDSKGLEAGEPIFPRVTCWVNFGFQYSLTGSAPKDAVVGSYQLLALITEPISGWQRTVTLVPNTPFTGNVFLTQAKFNVCQVDTIIEAMEAQTEFHPGSYTLSIEPVVKVTGTLSGHRLEDTFQPQLTFGYDRAHFYIIRVDPKVNPLDPSQPGLIRDFRPAPNTISALGINASVPVLRVGSLIFLILSVAGLIGLEKYLHDLADEDPHALVIAKYGSLMVDAQNKKPGRKSNAVEVATIDDLAKLAERNNVTMLHEVRGSEHYYFVDGNGVGYQYTRRQPGDPRCLNGHPEDEETGG